MTTVLTRTLDDIRRALVHVSPEDDPQVSGLGTICGQFILTCGHFGDVLRLPTHLHASPLFEARRIHDGAAGTLSLYIATSMDFMALAADGIHSITSDGGPTETAFNALLDDNGEPNGIHPTLLDFGDGRCSASMAGFFFSPDGQTRHRVKLKVHSHDPVISYDTTDAIPGCSGGPIFTDDLHLIGIHTNARRGNPGETGQGFGKRIDFCCPLFLQRQIKWDVLDVKASFSVSLPNDF